MRDLQRLILFGSLVFATGCGVHQSATQSLSGPSEFGLSIGVSASPDSIPQDGGSQSKITVTARDSNGRLMSGAIFHLDIEVDGAVVDFGTLSGRTLVTGTDGVATAVFTAPPPPPNGASIGVCGSLAGQCVSILATFAPTTGNFTASQTQSVTIRLAPTGVVVPAGPTPAFTASPASPKVNETAIFDASASCAGTANSSGCNSTTNVIANYRWDFGDGSSSQTVTSTSLTHTFTASGTYLVTLTVTTTQGVAASTTQAVTVGLPAGPTAVFTVSPSGTITHNVTTVFFDADSSTAAAGHSIVQFSWDFGDGSPGDSGHTTSHLFTATGVYTVTLTVKDDAGQTVTKTATVTVT